MTDAEDRLRTWLDRRAEQAPGGQGMLDRVRRESARRTRRHRVAFSGGLAVAAAMLVVGVVTIAGRPSPSRPSGTGNAGVTFVAGGPVAAAFPLALLGAPGDPTPVATLVAGRPTLVLPSFVRSSPMPVTVTVGTEPPPAEAKPLRLGVAAAAMAWNGTEKASGFSVWWTAPIGGWATISVPPEYPLGLIQKIISGLVPGSMPGAEPFTFATVPRGFFADNIDSVHVTFCPPDVAASPSDAGKIVVRLGSGPLTGAGEHVSVAGRPGLLVTDGAATELRVDEGAGRTVLVRVPSTIHVARADLLRFAAGILPTGS